MPIVMRQRLRSFEARAFPHGGRDALRQFLLFAAAYGLYQVVRGLVDGNDVARASWNATRIIDLERTLHVFVEPNIQAWTSNVHWLMDGVDWVYLNAHYAVTIGVLLYLYKLRRASFCFVRNAFLIAMAIALVGYAVYPTAPPRLMPEWGFTDSIKQFTGFSIEDHSVKSLLNLYAAVPSIHVCFAILVGWPMAKLVRRPWLKMLWLLYPLLVTFAVVATGNHYLTDAFLGAVTAAVSMLIADRLLARARPHAWSLGAPPAATVSATAG
jgi:membrane-associated phospholipid phosphatase